MPTESTASPPPPRTWARWWNRTRYRLYAPVYDALAWPMERGRQRALRWLDPAPDARILLSGCGTGLDLAYLPPETQVTALDAVPAMVRRTKARARTLGRAVDAQVGDAHALPFEDDSFDVVLLHLLLSVLPDPGAVLAEAARVLAPGGRISIYDKFLPPGTPPSLLRRLGNPVARLLVSDFNRRLRPMLAGMNLDLVTHREAGLWGLYTASVARLGSGQPGRQQ
ncbi:class I SAM-dependent methyltransferase [Salinibacter ruber]|uniref:class I SAM-dependent methyltransferase n=1 Tax=Salinibacter ruber TaxID=146919 RepID=UPI0021679E6B|nr:class I SAM-dependent methyltransferase [Salinibacter ruber]MCS3704874.1 SAM-dependent methyltransferase [Salinibacter ruber]